MFKQTLDSIAAFVLQHNPFFSEGYAGAWQDTETGHIWASTRSGTKPVFPSEKEGDMFYLRPTSNARLAISTDRFPVLECKLTGMMATATVRLVAVVKKSDSDALASRLVNTLALYDAGTLQVTGCNYLRETVLIEEMRYAEKDEQGRALKRLVKGMSIVSVDFNLSAEQPFKKLNCLPDICPTC